MHGFNILCEISKDTFEISHKMLNPHTANMLFAVLYLCVWFTISLNCDVKSLNVKGSKECTIRKTRAWIDPRSAFDISLYYYSHISMTFKLDRDVRAKVFGCIKFTSCGWRKVCLGFRGYGLNNTLQHMKQIAHNSCQSPFQLNWDIRDTIPLTKNFVWLYDILYRNW